MASDVDPFDQYLFSTVVRHHLCRMCVFKIYLFHGKKFNPIFGFLFMIQPGLVTSGSHVRTQTNLVHETSAVVRSDITAYKIGFPRSIIVNVL
jgi:hypothetical protein